MANKHLVGISRRRAVREKVVFLVNTSPDIQLTPEQVLHTLPTVSQAQV